MGDLERLDQPLFNSQEAFSHAWAPSSMALPENLKNENQATVDKNVFCT